MRFRSSVALLVAVFFLVACSSTSRLRSRLDFLVDYGATKQQIVAEFGEPVSTSATPAGETCVFIPGTRSKSKTVQHVVDGKATSETTTVSTPGKLRLTLDFKDGKLVAYSLAPNR